MTPEIINLWEGNVPLYAPGGEIPTLVYYPAQNKNGDGAVVVCPGGGYNHKARHEGEGYARFLAGHGLDAFVLLYRHSPEHFFPCQLLDARRAIRYVRANAEKYGINPNKIAIMGSSAGGHLAALTSTYRGKIDGEGVDELDEVCYLPSAQILCYPVITPGGHTGTYRCLVQGGYADGIKNKVNPAMIADKDTPPAFIWHTAEDSEVSVSNTYEYANQLYRLGVPVEMHIYPFGPHGLGLATGEELGGKSVPHVQSWAGLLLDWLKLYGYICE